MADTKGGGALVLVGEGQYPVLRARSRLHPGEADAIDCDATSTHGWDEDLDRIVVGCADPAGKASQVLSLAGNGEGEAVVPGALRDKLLCLVDKLGGYLDAEQRNPFYVLNSRD